MSGVSTLGQSLDQTSRIKTLTSQLDLISYQVTTGKKARYFSDLDVQSIISKRTRANFNQADTYISNIDQGLVRMQVMTQSLNEVKAQVSLVTKALAGQPQQGKTDTENIRRLAENVFNRIGELLNSKEGDRYLFAGTDTANAPYLNNGLIESATSSMVTNWQSESLSTKDFISGFQNMTQAQIGFNATISSAGEVYIRADAAIEVPYTVKANEDPFKQILSGLAVLKDSSFMNINNAPGTATADEIALGEDGLPEAKQDNFYDSINKIAAMLSTALDGIDSMIYRVGTAQSQTDMIKDDLTVAKNSMLTTMGAIEDVDITEAGLKLQTIGNTLEASFRVSAALSQFSLVNFL